MERFYHSVTLDVDKCVGCTNCIKRCPTEAIRVREGKAIITPERCIDCGVCIRVCPHHAKKAKFDHLEMLNRFTYNIALPAPSLYGQFRHLDHIDLILTALKRLGFDDIFEVSKAAELVSDATRKIILDGNMPKPIISSACPALCGLIASVSGFRLYALMCFPCILPWKRLHCLQRKKPIKKQGCQ